MFSMGMEDAYITIVRGMSKQQTSIMADFAMNPMRREAIKQSKRLGRNILYNFVYGQVHRGKVVFPFKSRIFAGIILVSEVQRDQQNSTPALNQLAQ